MLKQLENDKIDITLPANKKKYGTLHPLTLVQNELEDIAFKILNPTAYANITHKLQEIQKKQKTTMK